MSKHVTLVSDGHSSSLAIVDSCTKDKHQRSGIMFKSICPRPYQKREPSRILSPQGLRRKRNQGTDQSAHLTPTWIWTKMHCSTFTCGATTFTSTEPLQFCKWVEKSKWGKAGKGYKNNRTKLNDKLKNLKQNNQLWQTQFSQFSRETGYIFFLVCLVQFVHCQCDSWAPQHWDELLHDPTYSLQLCFG